MRYHVPFAQYDRIGQAVPRCPGSCLLRQEPSATSTILAVLGPSTPIKYVYSVSPTGWAHLYAQVNATTSLSGYVLASELSDVRVPSRTSQIPDILRRQSESGPFAPGPRPRPTEPAPAPLPTSPEPPITDILPSPTKTIYATLGEIAVLTSPAWAPMVLSALFSPPR